MAMTPEQQQSDQDEFNSAYAEDQARKPEPTEDEAFGLMPAAEPEAGTDAGESASDADAAGQAPAVAIVVEPGAAEDGDVAAQEEPTDPKDVQRAKSWEGRLKAREAALAAREAELSTKEAHEPEEGSAAEAASEGETMAEEAAEGPESANTETIEQVSEQVASGEMTADEAIATLSQDFGPEFAKMLTVIIKAHGGEVANKIADEKMSQVGGRIDGLIGELKDDRQKQHFEQISEAHPDYMEIANSPEFKAYVEAMPDDEKMAAMDVIGAGSARQINTLLGNYKASKEPQADPEADMQEPDSSAMDDAEGVRSGGMKLPDQPSKSDDYEAAWSQF
jgi:hypothetical protein